MKEFQIKNLAELHAEEMNLGAGNVFAVKRIIASNRRNDK